MSDSEPLDTHQLAEISTRIDQVVLDTIRAKLNIDPKVQYVLKNGHLIAYEVTLTWNEFTILAMPHLVDEFELRA